MNNEFNVIFKWDNLFYVHGFRKEIPLSELTISTEQSPWEANSGSANKDFPCI
jgi:hypothetical protein